jgi:hypothetical protein
MPAPGDYNIEKSWKSSQLPKRDHKVLTSARINFTDDYKNAKKYVPGSGKYNFKSYHILSKSPI